jgi:hypothetical protein
MARTRDDTDMTVEMEDIQPPQKETEEMNDNTDLLLEQVKCRTPL